jgi:hypothetical protein
MKENSENIPVGSLRVKPGKAIKLKDFDTEYSGNLTKEQGIALLDLSRTSCMRTTTTVC